MTTHTELDRVIRSLETVLSNGHVLIPVAHKDLRILIDAVKDELYYIEVGPFPGEPRDDGEGQKP